MSKGICSLLVLIVLTPLIQTGSPKKAKSGQTAATIPAKLLFPEDNYPRFSASLDSVSINGNGGVTATVTLTNSSTQPYYFDDQRLPRNVMECIRIWRVDSEKCITFGHDGCVLYADSGTRQFKKLSPGEKNTITVEFGGNTGEPGDFYESKPLDIPFETPPFKYLPIGRIAVTLQLGLSVYSSNPTSYVDRMRYEKGIVCQCSDLKWLTVTKTWP